MDARSNPPVPPAVPPTGFLMGRRAFLYDARAATAPYVGMRSRPGANPGRPFQNPGAEAKVNPAYP